MTSLTEETFQRPVGFHIASRQSILILLIAIVFTQILWALLKALYNLYFHPLRTIPGPKLWIAFPILGSYAQIQGHLDRKICKFHDEYGDCVRVTPDQVTFTSAQAWKDIYGHGHPELPKSFARGRGMNNQKIISADAPNHSRFRRAMLPAFSDKALTQQEPLIRVYVDLLVEKLREVASTGKPTNLVNWYSFTTFDLIGDLMYGEPLNSLRDGKPNDWIISIEKMMKLFPILTLASVAPLIGRMLLLLTSDKVRRSRAEHLEKATALAMKRINRKDQEHRGDFMDFIMRSQGGKHGLSDGELAANSDTIMVAGSETTATLLCGVTYYLLTSPDAMEKCTQEVRAAFNSDADITFREASCRLPYMLACLDEALRIFPPVPSVISRLCPPNVPTLIDRRMIPPNTMVGVHHLSASQSALNFHQPHSFHPERWLPSSTTNPSSPFYNDKRDACKPFSFGPRDCIGRNLAYHEMRLILAKVLWNFDLQLEDSCRGWAEGQRTWALWEKPPLLVEIRER